MTQAAATTLLAIASTGNTGFIRWIDGRAHHILGHYHRSVRALVRDGYVVITVEGDDGEVERLTAKGAQAVANISAAERMKAAKTPAERVAVLRWKAANR